MGVPVFLSRESTRADPHMHLSSTDDSTTFYREPVNFVIEESVPF